MNNAVCQEDPSTLLYEEHSTAATAHLLLSDEESDKFRYEILTFLILS